LIPMQSARADLTRTTILFSGSNAFRALLASMHRSLEASTHPRVNGVSPANSPTHWVPQLAPVAQRERPTVTRDRSRHWLAPIVLPEPILHHKVPLIAWIVRLASMCNMLQPCCASTAMPTVTLLHEALPR
jgi:hypothetical protein